jgi:hypothetical protein
MRFATELRFVAVESLPTNPSVTVVTIPKKIRMETSLLSRVDVQYDLEAARLVIEALGR